MPFFDFLKKHADSIICILSAVALCAVAALFIRAFASGALPYSADGDAFDTVYAVEEQR